MILCRFCGVASERLLCGEECEQKWFARYDSMRGVPDMMRADAEAEVESLRKQLSNSQRLGVEFWVSRDAARRHAMAWKKLAKRLYQALALANYVNLLLELKQCRSERDAMRAIVEALPRCDHHFEPCDRIATRHDCGYGNEPEWRCERHGREDCVPELPYADAVRAWERAEKKEET